MSYAEVNYSDDSANYVSEFVILTGKLMDDCGIIGGLYQCSWIR